MLNCRFEISNLRFAKSLLLAVLALCFSESRANAFSSRPNNIYIRCDDLGYGDVACLNPQGKIATPAMDRLAQEGMIFTDAHTGSSVCSPTRYGVMTGRYAWRTKLQSGVLGGLSPRLIEPGRMTAASFLKQYGYHTCCIGKWHLGMDWELLPGKTVSELSIESAAQVRNVDYTKPIKNGPTSVGFDEYFGISASLDMVPYTFIRNDRVVAQPTLDKDFELYLGRAARKTRHGPTAEGFDATNVLPELTKEAAAYIGRRAEAAKRGELFFLYLPLTSPHTPILPTKEWQNKSGISYYADFVMQTDATVGAVLDALDQHALTNNTLVILTSDNGCSPSADYPELLAKGHNPSHVFRGHKADVFEGGHRVPFIVRLPGRVKAGGSSDQTICLTDFLATCAEICGVRLPDNAGEDSVGFYSVLENYATGPLREATIHHTINGSFAVRQGKWKLCLCPGSGGWSAPRPGKDDVTGLPPVQLFNLETDVGETKNVQAEHPEIVTRMVKLLEQYVADGRSTPGPTQKNAVEVKIWKDANAVWTAPEKQPAKP
jgi:arylsulfatase A-like enzyme